MQSVARSHLAEEAELAQHASGHNVHEGHARLEHDAGHDRPCHLALPGDQRALRQPAVQAHGEVCLPAACCGPDRRSVLPGAS